MVKHGWIEDDNAETVFYQYSVRYKYDKENPGVYIELLKERQQDRGRKETY